MRAEPLDAETIVSATEELLRRHGPDKTTVLDVARLLGVSHGSVYRHFPSKAALREAVILRWLDRMRDGLTAAVRDTGPAPDRLRRLLTAMFAAKWAKARRTRSCSPPSGCWRRSTAAWPPPMSRSCSPRSAPSSRTASPAATSPPASRR